MRSALSRVDWSDLAALNSWQRFCALTLSLPLFVGSLMLAAHGWYLVALGCSFFFFTAALRQAHDGFHRNLGLPRGANDWFLLALSLGMMAPLHAIEFNHARHHRDPLGHDDVEGWSARMPGWLAIATGPLFTLRLVRSALRLARGRALGWILAECAILAVFIAWTYRFGGSLSRYHVAVMLAGNCLTGFFAVWLVHHGCDREKVASRTQRNRWLDGITFNLLYHFEHHEFPKVPSCHLPELARRIDRVAPPGWQIMAFPIGCRPRARALSTELVARVP